MEAAEEAAAAALAPPEGALAQRVRTAAARFLIGSASLDEPGFYFRGQEFQPIGRSEIEQDPAAAIALDGLLRLSRLSATVADRLRSHPDGAVRRAASLLAARGYPLLAAFDVPDA